MDEFGGGQTAAAPFVAPAHQRDKRRAEGPTAVGQPVFVTHRALLIFELFYDFGVDQHLQPIRKQGAGYPKVFLDSREPANPTEQITNNQQGPTVTDQIKRPLYRTVFDGLACSPVGHQRTLDRDGFKRQLTRVFRQR